jgi:hypothetical protein
LFSNFFAQYPTHAEFFSLNDVTELGELYVGERDELDLNSFMKDLTNRKREKNPQKI